MGVIKELISVVISLTILLGSGTYVLKVTHDFIQRAAVERIQKGLSSSENLAQQLTGERLDF